VEVDTQVLHVFQLKQDGDITFIGFISVSIVKFVKVKKRRNYKGEIKQIIAAFSLIHLTPRFLFAGT